MASKRLEFMFMDMVLSVLVALFYKAYNISTKNDIREYALVSIEKFQETMSNELDNM